MEKRRIADCCSLFSSRPHFAISALMKRHFWFVAVSCVFSILSCPPADAVSPELLQSDLARARTFVIGPWEAYIRPGLPYYYGPAAQEWELRKLLQAPDAASRMRWVLSHGTPEGQMYALYGLRQLNDPEFESIARRLQDRPGEILTTSMVIGFHKTRQEVIERIRENNFHS
jgi:hypothetical protein